MQFSKNSASNRWLNLFTRGKLCLLLTEKYHKVLDYGFLFVAAFIDGSMEHDKTAPMMRVHLHYCKNSASVTQDTEKRA